MTFVFYRMENIVGKGENAGYQHFLLFPLYFQKGLFPMAVKNQALFWIGLKGEELSLILKNF